jgi:hypothetical protein
MPVKAKQVKKDNRKIQFFGEVDLNDQGGIKSDMPAWYLERHIEYMEEDIRRKETAIRNRTIESDQVPMFQEEIKQEKARLKEIVDSKPNLNDAQRDRCYRAYESLQKQIKDSMPTRKQAKDGLVDPYNEMKRLKQKHISIDTQLASALGVKPVHGKINGDEANKCFQILGKALGEETNAESLRRDGGHPSYESINDYTKAILEGREIRD